MSQKYFPLAALIAGLALVAMFLYTRTPDEAQIVKTPSTALPKKETPSAPSVSAAVPPISQKPAPTSNNARVQPVASALAPPTPATPQRSVASSPESKVSMAPPPPAPSSSTSRVATQITVPVAVAPASAYEEELEVPAGARIPAALYDESSESTPAVAGALDQIADQFFDDVAEEPAAAMPEQTPGSDGQWEEAVTESNALLRSIVGFQRADRAERLSVMEKLGVSE